VRGRGSDDRVTLPLVADLLRAHVEPVLKEPTLILAFGGWNDAGDSATTALAYLDASFHTASLAEVDPEEFFDFTVRRPEVDRLADGGRFISWPTMRFRYGSVDADREVVTGIGVEPHLKWRTYCETVISFAQGLGVSRAVLLGAYQADVVYSQPVQVTGFATDEDVLKRLGVEVSDYQGPTGIAGVLGSLLEAEGIPVVSLWAGLPHYISISPNPRGALALLQKLSTYLELEIDEAKLRSSAEEFEERITKLVSSDSELSDYVRQLKRRDFVR
jgi:hypothetical protein